VTIFSIIEVVIFTILATIIALIYNVVSSLVGGVHVTLGDDLVLAIPTKLPSVRFMD